MAQKDSTEPGKPKNNVTVADQSDVMTEPAVSERPPQVESVVPVDLAIGKHAAVAVSDTGSQSPDQSASVSIDVNQAKDAPEPAKEEMPSNVTSVDPIEPTNDTQAEEAKFHVDNAPSSNSEVNSTIDYKGAAENTTIDQDEKKPQNATVDHDEKNSNIGQEQNVTIDHEVKAEHPIVDKEEKQNTKDEKKSSYEDISEIALEPQESASIKAIDPVITKTINASSSKRHDLVGNTEDVEQDLAALKEAPMGSNSNAPPVKEAYSHKVHHDIAIDAIDSIEQQAQRDAASSQAKLPGPGLNELPEQTHHDLNSDNPDIPDRLDTSPMRPRPLIIKPRPLIVRPKPHFCPPCRKYKETTTILLYYCIINYSCSLF